MREKKILPRHVLILIFSTETTFGSYLLKNKRNKKKISTQPNPNPTNQNKPQQSNPQNRHDHISLIRYPDKHSSVVLLIDYLSATEGWFQAPKCRTDCAAYVHRAKLLLPLGIVLEGLWRIPRRKWDTEWLSWLKLHTGSEDMMADVTSVYFYPSFGRLVSKAPGNSSIPVPWRSAGLGEGQGGFSGMTLEAFHVLTLSS